MGPSPPDSEDESLTPAELTAARKKEIAADLRALVKTPGWCYLCKVLESQADEVRRDLKEASGVEGLLALNSDLREIKTYEYLISLPTLTILEFDPESFNAD